ncbi:MAG: hypothetical protein QM702_21295 [Rubrivivax sp.]
MISTSSRLPSRVRVLVLFAAVALPIACNVFVTIGRCESDGDCPGGTCDPQGKYCVKNGTDAGDAEAGGDGPLDSPVDAFDAGPCNLSAPFGTPALVKGFENSAVFSARFSATENTVLLSILEPDGGTPDLYSAVRADPTAAFPDSGPTRLETLSELGTSEYWPTIAPTGEFIFFESDRSASKDGGAYGVELPRIWYAKKGPAEKFDTPELQSLFKTTGSTIEGAPYLHPDGTALYFVSGGRGDANNNLDLYVSTLGDFNLAQTPEPLEKVNTVAAENHPVVSLDNKTLFFSREDMDSIPHIFMATRAKPTDDFDNAQEVGELNTKETREYPSWLSNDSCRLYFVRAPRNAGADFSGFRIYVASRPK